jgi:TolB protein
MPSPLLRTAVALLPLLACASPPPSATRLYGAGASLFPAGWLATGDLLVTELTSDGQPRILVVARNGDVVRTIAGPTPQTWAGDPHPTADQFLAESYLGGVSDLYVLDLGSGGTVQRLTETPWNEWHPVWSPDGSSIVFDSDSAGGVPRLVVHDMASGQRTLPTSAPTAEQGGRWSPDGSRLAFHRLMRGGTTDYDVVILDVSSRTERLLTSESDDSSSPSWSPDGTRIVFSSNRSGVYQLYVACANGRGAPVRIAGPAADSKYPSWSRDGGAIAFQVGGDGIWITTPPVGQRCVAA